MHQPREGRKEGKKQRRLSGRASKAGRNKNKVIS